MWFEKGQAHDKGSYNLLAGPDTPIEGRGEGEGEGNGGKSSERTERRQ